MTLPPFQYLVDAHWRDVSGLAHALAGPVDGDDVAQQAWTQALAAYPRLRSSTNLRGWLLTITSDVSYVVEDTAVGRMLLARNESGALITSAYVPDTDAEDAWLQRLARQVSPRVLRLPRALDEARRELDAYLRGQRKDFDVPIALVLATSFQRIVLGHLPGAVAYGHRTTYGALAKEIERPSASRAVGAALGANPLCVVLPCHRVVASSGALTGYAGGLAAKEYLLTLESSP